MQWSRETIVAIERAEGANWARAFPEVLRIAHDAAVLPCAGGWALYGGRAAPLAYATGMGLEGPLDGADVAAVERFYRERGARPAFELSPFTDHSIYAHLAEGRYRPRFFLNVVAHDLRAISPAPPAVAVLEPATAQEHQLWERTIIEGFDEPNAVWMQSAIRQNGAAATVKLLAFIDDEPAGGAAFSVVDGVALLYGGSTRPAYRRRGVQSALVAARLERARESGCRAAISKMAVNSISQHAMERAGFRVLYSRVRMTGLDLDGS